MLKKGRKRKNINHVGKENYDFEYESERDIYYYLCCRRIKRKRLKAMSENVMFDSYMQWKQYIYDKCADYPNEKLFEFSKYLNQRIRNIKPEREYFAIVCPIFLTLLLSQFPEIIEGLHKIELQDVPFSVVIFLVIFTCMMMIPIIYFIYRIVSPIWDSHDDENFLMDYKEIIDCLLKERKKDNTNHQ